MDYIREVRKLLKQMGGLPMAYETRKNGDVHGLLFPPTEFMDKYFARGQYVGLEVVLSRETVSGELTLAASWAF